MSGKILFVSVSLVVFVFSGGAAIAACPSMDVTGDCRVDFADFAVFASRWLDEGEPLPVLNGMTWVEINDPGVSGHEPFNGKMSKYEITNDQYRHFLNDALASGDVIVDASYVKGADGSNSGEDFVGKLYYNLHGEGYTTEGVTNGGKASIYFFAWPSSGSFFVDVGFDNYPVTYVSRYGATAFCNYYGYRLPTEWEWQAAADHDGSWLYGCGTSIKNDMANYKGSTHPNGTTCVGEFGNYCYGLSDMAGNLYEWTSSVYNRPDPDEFVIRGGYWDGTEDSCLVSRRGHYNQGYTRYYIGFRVCR